MKGAYANSCQAVFCLRCVRALARDPSGVCTAPPAGSRQRKCGRCSRGGHRCEADPLPASQGPVLAAAAARQDVAGALRGLGACVDHS